MDARDGKQGLLGEFGVFEHPQEKDVARQAQDEEPFPGHGGNGHGNGVRHAEVEEGRKGQKQL